MPLTKGQKGKLKYTPSARHRVCIGVSWDAVEEAVERPELFRPAAPDEGENIESRRGFENKYGYDLEGRIDKVKETFDIDLVCLMFNSDGEIVDAVSPVEGEEVDQSGKVYHSGDERHGASANDDEIVSVELKDLPEYIHHLVFIAIIQSGHDYAYVVNPEARIYDSMSNQNLIKVAIDGTSTEGKTAFIFSRIYRGGGDWMVHYIGEFRVDLDVADWAEEVKPYLNG